MSTRKVVGASVVSMNALKVRAHGIAKGQAGRTLGRMRLRSFKFLGVLGAASMLLTACGMSTDSTYLGSVGAGAYGKAPAGWTTYTIDDVLKAAGHPLEERYPNIYMQAFTGPNGGVLDIMQASADTPGGVVFVRKVADPTAPFTPFANVQGVNQPLAIWWKKKGFDFEAYYKSLSTTAASSGGAATSTTGGSTTTSTTTTKAATNTAGTSTKTVLRKWDEGGWHFELTQNSVLGADGSTVIMQTIQKAGITTDSVGESGDGRLLFDSMSVTVGCNAECFGVNKDTILNVVNSWRPKS